MVVQMPRTVHRTGRCKLHGLSILIATKLGGVVSNIFYFHPYLGKIPILTNIFQRD